MQKKIHALIRLIRPKQWVKNIFVFTGVLFGEVHRMEETLLLALLAALSFCLISSAVYTFNDLIDKEQDKRHPKKKLRPLASGEVTNSEAALLIAALTTLSFTIGSIVSSLTLTLLVSYAFINILYTLYLKNVVILDVFCIASGFMLRILAGTAGIGIPPSKWLLLCGMMITLFLGFTKRKAEILQLKSAMREHRKVLMSYDSIFLDELIGITAASVIIAYSLYTMNDETIRIHHTENLIYTVPFVVFALFRYLYLINSKQSGGDPTNDLISDKQIMASVGLFTLLTFYLVH
ncbi:decaprenyl-phosphate phosphoribosyltransferase [Estrella lausannensis]|uniref:UbiA prenyltransferase n=1 Tax=Estrella lausannensis TaxID=483423 RepID=A0A0H5E663_9BACT|nr:decaprenyl-phosphate phosphoribosyltransferase [Estrella lausannensis]CRX38755.1 UbiA prenyltransferase [Estrella lausannensis]